MEGWVGLGWLVGYIGPTEISVRHPEMNPDTVAQLSTNRARRRWTSLIEASALTTTPVLSGGNVTQCITWLGIAETVFKVKGHKSRSWSHWVLWWRRHAFQRPGVEAHFVLVFCYVPNFQEIKDQKHPLHYLLPPVKVSNSQMILPPTYPYQLPLGKSSRYGRDFIPYCISKMF